MVKKGTKIRAIADLIIAADNGMEAMDVVVAAVQDWPLSLRRQFLQMLQGQLARSIGQREAIVRSATAIGDEDFALLERRFSEKVGRNLHFQRKVDPSLIAGLEVVVDDLRWEFSLSRMLRSFAVKH